MTVGEVEMMLDCGCEVGEGPCWDSARRELLWVDIPRGDVHRFDVVDGRHDRWSLGAPVTVVVPRSGGGWLLALSDRIVLADKWRGPTRPLVNLPRSVGPGRLNDGKCDSAGRLWIGSMVLDEARGSEQLYLVDAHGTVQVMLSDISLSNGLGWSPDDRTMYYVDTYAGGLDAMDYDPIPPRVGRRRRLVTIQPQDGLADGLAVDAEGCVWLAIYGGAAVCRYGPDGDLRERVSLPVSQITSCCFGGSDMQDLFVTSAASVSSREPHAGALWRIPVSTPGLPSHPFSG